MKNALLLLALIAGTFAAPRTIVLHALLRDFDPPASAHGHPDFETYSGNSRGSVADMLDQDGKPALKAGGWPTFTSATAFAQWYRDSDRSVAVNHDLNLVETGEGTGIFEYSNTAYFPLDGKGWPPGTYGSSGHNFHFTTEVSTTFTYQGNETFSFQGDDDLWVFINGIIAIDLGGVHGPQDAVINLADEATRTRLNLVIGQDATLNIFGAERHTSGSNFKITTSLKLVSTSPNATNADPWICGVQIPNFGAGLNAADIPLSPAFRYFGIDEGLSSFDNFNTIVFGDWTSGSGDTEGRFTAAGNVRINGGYSFGEYITNAGAAALDKKLPYSVVVGGNFAVTAGSVKPDGSSPSTKAKEDAFVAGSISGSSAGLQARVTGRCASGSTCLNADFTNAQNWYKLASATLAAQPSNANIVFAYGGATVQCSSNTATAYYTSMDAAAFDTFTYWNAPASSCNRAASLVINVVGTATTINFGKVQSALKWGNEADQSLLPNKPSGDNQNKLIWNIVGNGRTIAAGSPAHNGILLAPTATLNHPSGVWKGIIIVGAVTASNQVNRLVCPAHPLPPNPPPSTRVCPYFENSCPGFALNFPQRNTIASFRDYNVVAFGNFYGRAGDVEGRLAVGGNADLDSYSIGYEIYSNGGPDRTLPYAFVVNGNLQWGIGGGQVWPFGNAIDKWPAFREEIFVGGTANVQQYTQDRILGTCPSGQPNCLAAFFDAAKGCYNSVSNAYAALPANVDVSTQYGNGLLLKCRTNTATRYVANVNGADLGAITWYFLDGCNFHSEWIINVVGTGDFTISGGSFPAVAGGVVYNVIGNRNIKITATSLAGHILAPGSNLNQTNSVIVGKVVVNNFVFANQINKPCPSSLNTPVLVPSVVVSSPLKRQEDLSSFNALDAFVVGDVVTTDGGVVTIVEKNGGHYTVDPALNNALAEGSVVYTRVTNITASRDNIVAAPSADASSEESSSASALAVIFAAIAMLLALF